MFERYTERARRVVFLARYEASQLGSAAIETEHLLLGVIREADGFTGRLFATDGRGKKIRREIEGRSAHRDKVSTSVDIPLSQESRRALSHAAEESRRMLHENVDIAHILLGLLREEDGVAAVALRESGVQLASTREAFLMFVDEAGGAPGKREGPSTERGRPHGESEFTHGPSDYSRGGDPQEYGGLFARFTERARRVVFFARYEAARLGAGAIEAEHLLLGLLREEKGIAARILARRNVSLDETFREIELRRSPVPPSSIEIPLSLETKRVLAHAAQEGESLRHHYIGTEHLLLGLLREKASLAAVILDEKGIELGPARDEVLGLLAEAAAARGAPVPSIDVELQEADPPPLKLSDLDCRFLRSLKITPEGE
jgi:ATP-dependent Clp protease ATP-binding subunit ClpA